MDEEILAVVEASAARRWTGIVALSGFAAVLLYVAWDTVSGWQAFLVLLGVLALWTARRTWQATSVRIELTAAELRDSAGSLIVRVDDIASLDRGSFAFKPSNGFLIKTKTPGTRVWRPGMWWRFGRRIGIGGVTPAAQAKFMAETLARRLAEEN